MLTVSVVISLSLLLFQGKAKSSDNSFGEIVTDNSTTRKWTRFESARLPIEEEFMTVKRPINVSLTLTVYPLIAGGTLRYYLNKRFGVDVSVQSILAILAYKAEGFTFGLRYMLNPQQRFSPFLYGCVGPLWKNESNKRKLEGSMVSSQFGWNYISEEGPNIFVSLGPTVLFVSGEKTMIALIQVGVGWNF